MKSAGMLPTGRRRLWWHEYTVFVFDGQGTRIRTTIWAASTRRARRHLGAIVGGAR